MSVFWKTPYYGYDGDEMHGHICVNYWQDRAQIEAEFEKQVAEIREAMLADWSRLTGHE
jgi:hypothetical protein